MTAKHQPTEQNRKTVEAMCGYGIPHADIARVLSIDPKTLRLHYREELDTAHTKANARVGESVFLQAVGAPAVFDQQGNMIRAEQPRVPSAGIWWTKARMGWRETTRVETTGADGGPVQVEHAIDLKSLPDDALAKLAAVAEAIGERD